MLTGLTGGNRPFLANNRRKVLTDKGLISHDYAVKKVSDIYNEFRKRQDEEYVSEFDKVMEKYLKETNVRNLHGPFDSAKAAVDSMLED